jgi:uncharacterized protein YcnI
MAVFGSLALGTSAAHAHVSASASGAYANTTVETNFNVGHGCEGLDTYSIKINIPDGVTGLRVVENGSFANVTIEKDAAGNVTSVTFTKAQSAVRAEDDAFYKLVLRFKLPDKPFTTLYFPANQVCKSQDGATTKNTDWVATTPSEGEGGPEPAPALYVLPARKPGWNKYSAPAEIKDLATVFADAQIVWSGDDAFSANSNTAAQIAAEDGVGKLQSIAAGSELWVKY